MIPTVVIDLLTEEEFNEIVKTTTIFKDDKIANLTWKQLSNMAGMLIRNDWSSNTKRGSCYLAAAAIEILTERAMKHKLPLF